ncbi:phage protein GemA/Gp16 family protein [Aliikangiella maris]|uniref:Phage protein GemA/Gp16 family protein n=2 Tax=Aliikangiella maris TaxID=3162458 RepID=A0ABV2BPW7_9GAMM
MFLERYYYIKHIEVGKKSLELDMFSYVRLLHSLTGKVNINELNNLELTQVFLKFLWLGYNPQLKAVKNQLTSRTEIQLKKLRQLWCLMSLEGYCKDTSDKGLFDWAKHRINNFDRNLKIDHLEWFPDWIIKGLLEELESQYRCYTKTVN